MDELEIKKVIDKLKDVLSDIFYHIEDYKKFFNEDVKTKKLMESVKTTFFNDLYWLYWNYITIRICNLLAPSKTSGNKNLSLDYLIESIDKKNIKCLNIIKDNIKNLKIIIKPFRDARNKIFAHHDLDIMLSIKKLETLKLDDIESVALSIGTILNEIDSVFGGATTIYCINNLRGANIILHAIEMKNKYWELHKYIQNNNDIPNNIKHEIMKIKNK